jgi:hypothetical protein
LSGNALPQSIAVLDTDFPFGQTRYGTPVGLMFYEAASRLYGCGIHASG